VATTARNQHGTAVLRYRRSLLVYRRDATPASRADGLTARCGVAYHPAYWMGA